MKLLVAALGALVALPALAQPPAAGEVCSMSNKVEAIETTTAGDLLLVRVRTGLYHTRGDEVPSLEDPPLENINPVCGNDDGVIVRLDGTTPGELLETQLMLQTIETARIGPFRLMFLVVQGECVEFPGLPGSFPVAVGVKLLQNKDP